MCMSPLVIDSYVCFGHSFVYLFAVFFLSSSFNIQKPKEKSFFLELELPISSIHLFFFNLLSVFCVFSVLIISVDLVVVVVV